MGALDRRFPQSLVGQRLRCAFALDLGPTRKAVDWAAHLWHVVGQFPNMARYDWIVDNLNTHWSLEVCLLVAELCELPIDRRQLRTGAQRRAFLTDESHKHVFHFTPIHGSWLNQVELFFSVVARQFLKRGDFGSLKEFEAEPRIFSAAE